MFILVALNFNKSYFNFLNNFLSIYKCLNVFKGLSLAITFSSILPSKLFFARSQIVNKISPAIRAKIKKKTVYIVLIKSKVLNFIYLNDSTIKII